MDLRFYIDPATRLVNVLVALPPNSPLLLDTFVTARIEKASTAALVVPRDVVLPSQPQAGQG